jgi:hypothetical protein
METPQKQKEGVMVVQSMLLSPPEAKRSQDTFSAPVSPSMSRTPSQLMAMGPSSSQGSDDMMVSNTKKVERLPLSPPISPAVLQAHIIQPDEGARDPPLFPLPREDEAEVAAKTPLFPPQDDSQAAIDQHIATHGQICKEDEYRLVLATLSNVRFNTTVSENYNRNPQRWLENELKFADFYRTLKLNSAKAAAEAEVRQAAKLRRLAPAPEGGIRKKVITPRVQRQPKPRPSPQSPGLDDFTFATQARVVKAPRQPTVTVKNEQESNYAAVPDYCPPTDTLGSHAKALKTDWKGHGIPMTNDPDLHMLHEAEVQLASTLRLSAAVYLTNKRRIFQSFVERLRLGEPFRKTHAQQACKIDVNKASKLWSAFDKAGWFDEKHFVHLV